MAAGLVAFVAVFASLRDRREVTVIAVAAEPIPAATEVTDVLVRPVELPADSPLLGSVMELDDVPFGEAVTTRPVAAGEPLTSAALAPGAPAEGRRSMSLPIPPENAVAGALRAGDRVDVLGADGTGQVGYIAVNLEVLAVGEPRGGTVGSAPGEATLTVSVDAAEALRVATALGAEGEAVQVVRSTGAEPVTAVEAPALAGGGG